ncbi:hypothetical protein GCM10023187_00080 [Nibrella viscosa]|uniref:Cytochrome c domain-containing protein n=1 Tax=Nibrella viscosa TaxID=1084524 RepID=A0ABP8JQS7_9BACT
MRYFIIFLIILMYSGPTQSPRPLSAEHKKALASFQLIEGFRIELVAAEPLVADPVAMEVDERGRMYVVEMPGYPLDLGKSGKVKLLKDTNGDGYPDKSVVFADQFTLPTGVMRWQKGIIVTDAPDVWYLEDTNGDDKADVRKKLLTGFALSNPQHNLNTPVFGLDNWIYLAHEGEVTPFVYKKEFGDKGSEIRFPDNPNAPVLARNAHGRNVRFRPDTYELEELAGKTQYGQTFDPWGHQLGTSNADHLFHEVLAARYIARNPNLLVPDATQHIPDHGNAAEVYPITENPNDQLLTDRGVITSSCGVTWYNGGAFGERFNNVTFVGEPSHNLVHADVITDKGASFVASRLLEKKEFLASKDSWFRPVSFYVGPEGALYVIDYYRQSIEHPEWMSEEMVKSGTMYNGKDKGRIYRIVPEKGLPMNWLGKLRLDRMSGDDLVDLLQSPNGWYRRTAQRLLYQRQDKAVVKPLKRLTELAKRPEAKVHALWLLDGLKSVDTDVLLRCLRAKEPGVRENAIRVAERQPSLLTDKRLTDALLAMQADPSAKVRFQALCTLGDLTVAGMDEARVAILKQDIDDKWAALAALTSAAGQEWELYQVALREFGNAPSPEKKEFFAYLGATMANKKTDSEVPKLLASLTESGPNSPAWVQSAVLSGVARLWQSRGVTVALTDANRQALLPDFSRSTAPDLLSVKMDLLRLVGLPKTEAVRVQAEKAATLAIDAGQPEGVRSAAVRLLALYNPQAYQNLLERLVIDPNPDGIRKAAFESISQVSGPQACALALRDWTKLSPDVKQTAVGVFLRNAGQIHSLLDAIDQQKVARTDLTWPQMVRLMNYYDADIRAHARKVLAVAEDRKAVVQRYMTALNQQGDAGRGKQVFQQVCSACHQMGGKNGQAFGPDLASLRNRNPHSILTEILHPNNSIADGYDYCTVTLRNGKQTAGIIANETATAVTLRLAGGSETVIARSDIAGIDKAQTSAMPVGLEASISVAQMADLLAYIRQQ